MTWFLCLGRCAGSLQRRSQRLPALRASNQRVATPDTYFRPPGRPCRKESQTVSLIPFRIPWIATAVGCQSTHARLRSPSRGGQPALASTSAPGARDRCRQPPLEPETTAGNRPRLYKSSSSCPLRATGPQVWNRILCPRPLQGNQPPRLQKQLKSWTIWDNQSPQQSRSPRLLK